MAHTHSVYDGDKHFTVDPVTRAIHNASDKVILMQNDHNSERFTFEIPRHIDGHDMSLCNVAEVHYNNICSDTKEQNSDVYTMLDFQVSPDAEDVVICSWLISRSATKYAGSLNFVLRLACVSEDGTPEYQWFTDIHRSITVSSGIYNTEAALEEYADILASWEAEVIAGLDSVIAVQNELIGGGSA